MQVKNAASSTMLITDLDQKRHDIAADYHADESTHVNTLLENISFSDPQRRQLESHAMELVHQVRANRKRFGGLDSFLNEYGLTTDEGIALMCLAEALLRVPDRQTADLLIKDKIGSADWDEHVGKGSDLFVNASTWALMLTGKVIGTAEKDRENFKPSNLLQKLVKSAGEPVVRQAMYHAMRILGHQFVIGRTIKEAMKTARPQEKNGYRYSYDMLGEAARTMKDADRYFKAYKDAIDQIGETVQGYEHPASPIHSAGISVKISALHPRYFATQKEKCMPLLVERLTALAQKCKNYNIGMCIDAEEAHRLDLSLEIIQRVRMDPSLKGWDGFGLALQAYQKRAWKTVDWLAELARMSGQKLMVRLVKGAYWDSEIKYAQERGLPGYPVFTRKYITDVSYLACARKMLELREVFYPQFATHNAHTVSAIISMAGENQTGFEFQRLHGMGEPLYHQLIGTEGEKGKYPVRVYAPVGSHEDLLPYLVRRLLENGANSSFVNRIQDDRIPVEDMVVDPLLYVRQLKNKPHPKIPLPRNIYDAPRKNATGIELYNTHISLPLEKELLAYSKQTAWKAPDTARNPANVYNPAHRSEIVGTVDIPTQEDIKNTLATADDAFTEWSRTPAQDRASCLNTVADLMEEHLTELMALCIREAGKTIADALADVREAIDFCRYYAIQGQNDFGADVILPGPTGERNTLGLTGRGVFLCISPWNFPIAIFTGQVAAALMAGNTVIAKPAEQTPLIARRVIELFYKAGVPENVLHYLPISGKKTGELLVADPRVTGVAFTGSNATARHINSTLANRSGPIATLIAETGGQNAMIVDNSALAEQVIDDMIVSGFQSAGQRCSALRVLYVQKGIADTVIEMLNGAAQELTVGDPSYLATDIGPVIDQTAQEMLQNHAAKMDNIADCIAQTPIDADIASQGTYFAPRAYAMKNTDSLKEEIFGPVIHIVKYEGGHLDKVINDINNFGYGLTLGVHSRIDDTVEYILSRVRVGNSYVNRSMTGAVVGVQPFGGMGLSGTGPKAGGPHYLHRFATEQTVTVNTTASGGNTSLVSMVEDDAPF